MPLLLQEGGHKLGDVTWNVEHGTANWRTPQQNGGGEGGAPGHRRGTGERKDGRREGPGGGAERGGEWRGRGGEGGHTCRTYFPASDRISVGTGM